MGEEDYQRLKGDISANGYDSKNPIWLYDGEIIDGWNRQKACNELEVTPTYKEFEGTDSEAITFVMRTNKRRNLTSSQWACIAVEADELMVVIREAVERGKAEKMAGNNNAAKEKTECQLIDTSFQIPERVTSKAAALFNTNRTYVSEAAKLRESNPEVFEAVKSGEKTFTEVKREAKKDEQKERFEILQAKELSLTCDNYDVIVIDPPWQMEKILRDVAPEQIGFDYPTMTTDQIKEIELPASDSCHVFMWITHKHLPDGFDIFKEWGVKYVCCFVWHKNGGFQPFGLPQYNCEFVLYGRIGTPEFFDLKDFNVCFNADRTGHSQKPDAFYNTINRVTVGKRIDMFNRRQITGFDSWGNEAI